MPKSRRVVLTVELETGEPVAALKDALGDAFLFLDVSILQIQVNVAQDVSTARTKTATKKKTR